MDANFVIPALREYIENRNRQFIGTPIVSTISRQMKSNDVQRFWHCYEEIFTTQKERLWNSLENGLTRYLHVNKFYIFFCIKYKN